MKNTNKLFIAMFFMASLFNQNKCMEEPDAQEKSTSGRQAIVDRVRAVSAIGMGVSGINYIRTVLFQQTSQQNVPVPRGFRNPALRWLTAFFSFTLTQQATVNMWSNPELSRLWRNAGAASIETDETMGSYRYQNY